jgi:hypothetical protein
MSGGYFEHNCIIASGMIADCILGADFLDKFQVTVSFKDQCTYNNDENGGRRHQFVSEEKSTVDLKEETPTSELRKYNIGRGERQSSSGIEEEGDRSFGVLASDIAYNKRKFPLSECDSDRVKRNRGFVLQTRRPETHRMLKKSFGDNVLGQTQTYERFNRFKNRWTSVDVEERS